MQRSITANHAIFYNSIKQLLYIVDSVKRSCYRLSIKSVKNTKIRPIGVSRLYKTSQTIGRGVSKLYNLYIYNILIYLIYHKYIIY